MWEIIALMAVCAALGSSGSVFVIHSREGWYEFLKKPSFTPPDWLFTPVWMALYMLMGLAMGLVLRADTPGVRTAAYAFSAQMLLNMLWSPIFFGLQKIGAALVELALLWIAIAVTIFFFAKVSALAAWLLVPYILWVTVAGRLNYEIWRLNRNGI